MKLSNSEQLVVDLFADDFGFFDRTTYTAMEVSRLFQISVGRCLVKEMRSGMVVNTIGLPQNPDRFMRKFKSAEELSDDELQFVFAYYREFSLLYSGEIKNVVHLLHYSVVNDEDWLKNVDALGRPKKLMKTSDIEVLNKFFRKYRKISPAFSFYPDATKIKTPSQPELPPLTKDDEEHFADLGVGHTIVKLLTPLALQHEGRVMKNCIGDKKYDRFLSSKDDLLLSIRYQGVRIANIHVCQSEYGWRIKEFLGKRNNNPDQYLGDLVASQNWLTSEEYFSRLRRDIFNTDEIRVFNP